MSFLIKFELPQNIIKEYFDGLVKVEEAKNGKYIPENKSVDVKVAVENKSVDVKVAVENKSVDKKSVENKSVDKKSVDKKSVDKKSVENKSVENKSVENKSVENKSVTIVFGKNKLSKWVYSSEDYKFINKHGYIEHLCEKIDGIIVDEDNIISDDEINYTYKFLTSYLILNKSDFPNKTIYDFLDENNKITNDFNREYIEKSKNKIKFGDKSTLILSKIEFPKINDEFINEVQDMLNDECKKYIGEPQKFRSSTHIIPYNKYSCIIIDYDDFLGLKYDQIDRVGRDLFYKIEHMYDKSIPLRTTEEVNKQLISNTFTDLSKNITDNIADESCDFNELFSSLTDKNNEKSKDLMNLMNLIERLLCDEIKIEEIMTVATNTIGNMNNDDPESNKK